MKLLKENLLEVLTITTTIIIAAIKVINSIETIKENKELIKDIS
jgi:hypothetical protein